MLDRLLTEPKKVIELISSQTLDYNKIGEYRKEYYKNDRELRLTQVGKVQKTKIVDNAPVQPVRVSINFAKKIVTTATAFEVGKPVTLIPSEESDLSNLHNQVWKLNRIDAAISEVINTTKIETQSAIQFYISDIKSSSTLKKVLKSNNLKDQQKEIKIKVLSNSKGVMTPFFDELGDMICFMWQYKFTDVKGKELNAYQIWDETNCHYLSDESGDLKYKDEGIVKHGFDRIPIVYKSQDQPEWFVVKEAIDRYEVSLSKLGVSNDYSAYPLLQIFGEIQSMPNKDSGGKILQFPIKVDQQGNQIHGKAEFLEARNAVDSCKLEFDNLKELIFSISQTPDLSFNNVKGLGNVSAVALKLLFLDAVIKASINEGENRTMIERIANIITSGIVNTTNTYLMPQSEGLYFDVIFNSIVPSDLKATSDILIALKNAGLISSESAVKLIDLVENPAKELEIIKTESNVVI